jgi:hypothetical protein
MKKRIVSLAGLHEAAQSPGAELYLTKPRGWEFELIPFKSRLALTEFNKRAGLRPLVYDVVRKGMKIHAHQREEA